MTVFANGLEVSCKAQANKVIAAFPYVAFTPPQTPATPPGVPIPYPTFGMDSDTDKGTGTVKIGGKTVNQKNVSYYAKCTGDEAGCAPKKNIITSKNTGKTYAHAWSGDVKADGEPVQRFSDIASNDHASPTGGGPPFAKIGKVAGAYYSTAHCLIGEYDAIKNQCSKVKNSKGEPYEAHHIIPDKAFRTGTRAQAEAGVTKNRIANAPSIGKGMCICLSPKQHDKAHELEREALDGIGKADLAGKTGVKLDAAKEKAKKAGTYGTGDVTDVYVACQELLEELDLTDACVKKAVEATDEQWAQFEDGQTVRTSNALPGKAAGKKMMNR